jgi:hypothetical protein
MTCRILGEASEGLVRWLYNAKYNAISSEVIEVVGRQDSGMGNV